jgi:hypothetical protein
LIGWGVVLAALLAAIFIGWGLSKSAEYEGQAYKHASEYAAYTNQQIKQTCVGPPSSEKAQCVAKARHEQRGYERNEYDLVAQRQSALWAYIMGAAAVIGMGLSVVGVILVWTTFAETRESNVIAKAAAAEVKNAAQPRMGVSALVVVNVANQALTVSLTPDHRREAFDLVVSGSATIQGSRFSRDTILPKDPPGYRKLDSTIQHPLRYRFEWNFADLTNNEIAELAGKDVTATIDVRYMDQFGIPMTQGWIFQGRLEINRANPDNLIGRAHLERISVQFHGDSQPQT